MRYIDLRSDTVTMPTEEMRTAMLYAEVGDDVYEDDPTVKKLESLAAKMVGKEAALFVPTGTMGNQLAVLTHTKRGDEVILEEHCHIIEHEVGATAVISGVQLRTVRGIDGVMQEKDVLGAIRDEDIHYPETGLICMENALSNGKVVDVEHMRKIYKIGEKRGIPVHLDGARLFNAATSLDIDVKEIAACADSVMFCLSKGLCAPIGSMLAGKKSFIDRARKNRKLLGGGMRQAGVLAAPGIVALEKMTKRLKEDHENARYMAEKLAALPYFNVMKDFLDINMVFFEIEGNYISSDALVSHLDKKGIKINPIESGLYRFVTNNDVNRKDIDYLIDCIDLLV